MWIIIGIWKLMKGIDITGQRFGRLTAIKLVPLEERTWSNKERAWLCKCDCGNEIIVRQRNLRSARMTKSCGCLRKIDAFLATTHIPNLTEEYLFTFSDFDKFLFIHKALRDCIKTNDKEYSNYKNYLEYFYYDKQFNNVYDFWKTQEKTETFYDWAKPSLDHIIPKSKGGTNEINNFQFLTVFENLAKRDMTMEEWNIFKQNTNTKSDYFIENIMKGGDA